MTRMQVHIERLVLDGLALDARAEEGLRASLEAELLELATGDGARSGRRGDAGDASSRTESGEKASSATLGRMAAHAIHRHVAG